MANITRFDPFNELVDDLFKGFLVRPLSVEGRAELPRMKVDVAEKNGAYLVTAEIPGVKKEDIQVTILISHSDQNRQYLFLLGIFRFKFCQFNRSNFLNLQLIFNTQVHTFYQLLYERDLNYILVCIIYFCIKF